MPPILALTILWSVFFQPSPPVPLLISPAGLTAQEQAAAQTFSNNFVLTVTRRYGLGEFLECRITVDAAMARLWCTHGDSSTGVPRPSTAQARIGDAELTRLRRLGRLADLYGGKQAGRDSTATDGIFETLTVTNSQGLTVVLVTSGNPSFQEGGRKELLDALKEIEARLRKSARR